MGYLNCVTKLFAINVLLTYPTTAKGLPATAAMHKHTEKGEYSAFNWSSIASHNNDPRTAMMQVPEDTTAGMEGTLPNASFNATDIIFDIEHYDSNVDDIKQDAIYNRNDQENNTTEATDTSAAVSTDSHHDWIQNESQKFTLYWAGWYIHLIWLPIVVPIGIAGNLMSFIIMTQKENQQISCCLYMAALAVTDSVALFRKGYEWLIYKFNKPYVQIECQILAYLGLGSVQYGMFLIIAMTVDRVLAIKFPLKAHIYCSTTRAKVTIFLLLVVTCLYNIPHFLTARQIGNPPFVCTTFAVHIIFLDIYAWGSTIINFLLPFIALLVMNIIIVSIIRNRKKILTSGTDNVTGDNSADHQLSIMLSLVGIFFVILNVPQCIRLTMFLFVDRWSSPYNHAIYVFVFHFSNKTYYTNNGINFFLYCFGGSKFRQSLRKLCCCCCSMVRKQDKPTVTDSSSLNSV